MLVVDADEMVRATLKAYLGSEGYDVMAVSTPQFDAREVMNMFTPALVIAEVEGDGLPGLRPFCAREAEPAAEVMCRSCWTTSSGYPSGAHYSNAHALGAVVCMTKPLQAGAPGLSWWRLVAPLRPRNLHAEKWRAASGRSQRNAAATGMQAPNGGAKSVVKREVRSKIR